jgi:chorismate synthase
MGGNSFGTLFRITTWGESHGTALGAVIDGTPPGLDLSVGDIQSELDRRRTGQSAGASPRKEGDKVEILSGVFEGKTTGTPISLLIRNEDVDSAPYEEWKEVFRPGQADFTYWAKYGIRDHRGGGRGSARETVGRVAAGAIAKKALERNEIRIDAYTIELGAIRAEEADLQEADRNIFRCLDARAAEAMKMRLSEAKARGDSVGGIVEVVARGCPAGLGEPVFDKLEADLAKGLMSIGAVRGVEVGAGFGAARLLGSECNDPIGPDGFEKNDAGGILGGISTGSDIRLRVAIKPIPSISLNQRTVDHRMRPVTMRMTGRHDVCAIPRILPVCEAMTAIVLLDHLLRQKAVK